MLRALKPVRLNLFNLITIKSELNPMYLGLRKFVIIEAQSVLARKSRN